MVNQGGIHPDLFDARCTKFSLGDDVITEYIKGEKTWPSMGATRWALTPLALGAMMKHKDNINNLKLAYMSKLLVPGTVAVHRGAGGALQSWWILGNCEYGALGLPLRSARHKALKYMVPVWSGSPPWIQIVLDSWQGWSAAEVSALPPSQARTEFGVDGPCCHDLQGIVLRFLTSPGLVPCHVIAARHGFRGMTVEEMKMLANAAEAWGPGRKPTLEKEIATVLIRWALPDVTDSDLEVYLSKRGAKDCRHATVLDNDNIKAAEGFLQEDDLADVKRGVARSSKAPANGGVNATHVATEGLVSSSAGGVSATGSGAVPVGARKALPAGIWTQVDARAWLPQVPGCSISIHKNERWQVRYNSRSVEPRSWSRFWKDGPEGPSHFDILLLALSWAWVVHAGENPSAPPCPHELPPTPL